MDLCPLSIRGTFKNSLSILILFPILFALLLSGCADNHRVMSGEEVHSLFAGKTVKGYHEKSEYSFVSYYEPTGTFRSYQGGSGEPRSGKWWVDSGSENICIEWEDEQGVFRRTMVTDDDGRYWKILVKPNGKRIPIVTFEEFTDGNVNNL